MPVPTERLDGRISGDLGNLSQHTVPDYRNYYGCLVLFEEKRQSVSPDVSCNHFEFSVLCAGRIVGGCASDDRYVYVAKDLYVHLDRMDGIQGSLPEGIKSSKEN